MLRILSRNLGSVCILCLQGKLVIGETDGLVRTVLSISDAGTVVLDMAHVSMIDASGLGVLLELREELQAKGIEFQLRNVTNLVGHVLELTRLNSVFKVTSGVEFFSALSCGRLTTTTKLAPCA
jgi:anti-anti-sigma factor